MKEKIHIREGLNNLESWFIDHFCQIYLSESSTNMEPEGSGILLEIFGMKLLLTAGHVIMDGKLQKIVIPRRNSEGAFSLAGIWYPSDTNFNIGKDQDDYAYLIMQEEAYLNFINSGYKFITLNHMNFEHIPSNKMIYTLVGCKWRKTKKVGIDRYVKVEIITNIGAGEYAYDKYDSIENRIIVENRRKFLNKDNQKEIIGKLDGMSGGAIWATNLNNNYHKDFTDVQLVGVLNSYDSNYIFGTNIKRLLTTLVERNHGNIVQK